MYSFSTIRQDFMRSTARLLVVAVLFAAFVLASNTIALGSTSTEAAVAAEARSAFPNYQWNLANDQRPLISLPGHVTTDIDLSLTYPMDQFGFPVFQPLYFNERAGKYILLLIPKTSRRAQFVELQKSAQPGSYSSNDGSGIQLQDSGATKTIRTADATLYTFVRFGDGAFRCTRIKQGASSIYLNYTKEGLIHSITDSSEREVKFDYANNRLGSVTQTWTVSAVGQSKTWQVGENAEPLLTTIKYREPDARDRRESSAQFHHPEPAINVARAATIENNTRGELERLVKSLPTNAATTEYTQEMAASDWLLAAIFGGPTAVAAANGFEPPALSSQYPLYRGDVTSSDGKIFRGHLSYAMHLYGSADGTGTTPLYVPLGFTSHSAEPSPTDAAMTFYYPRLGNLTDVTVAVFHVADFGIVYEAGRVRIGNIGGPGGSAPMYRHSHIEFYRGNTGLPPAAARPGLRIDPVTVFDVTADAASRARRTNYSRESNSHRK